MLYMPLINQLYITNNMKRFSFKSERSLRVAKLTKTDWLVVLQLEFRRNTTLYALSLKYLSIERVKPKI